METTITKTGPVQWEAGKQSPPLRTPQVEGAPRCPGRCWQVPGGRCSFCGGAGFQPLLVPVLPVRPLDSLGAASLAGWGAAAFGWPHSCTLSPRIEQLSLLVLTCASSPLHSLKAGMWLHLPCVCLQLCSYPSNVQRVRQAGTDVRQGYPVHTCPCGHDRKA